MNICRATLLISFCEKNLISHAASRGRREYVVRNLRAAPRVINILNLYINFNYRPNICVDAYHYRRNPDAAARAAETWREPSYLHTYIVAWSLGEKKKRESERKQPVKDARLTLINRRRKQVEHHSRSLVISSERVFSRS